MNTQLFSESSILITGGAGFVGSNLTKKILDCGANKIHIIDNLLSSEEENIPKDTRITFTKGSIADVQVLQTLQDNYDYIFHLSTYHGNQSSIADPIADHENNTLTTLKLFEKIKDWKRVKKVVYSAAGCAVAEKTYDTASATSEDAPISLEMDSPYSISKIIGEFYSVYYHRQHQIPVVRARFQNVYGPGEILGAGKWRGTPATVWRNVVPTFIYKALHNQPLMVEGDGTSSRDFIYVDDIVNGLIKCALHGKPGDVYNLASGKETTILDLANKINSLAQNRSLVDFLPPRNWDHSGKRFGSTEKSKKEIGFSAETSLDDGLKKTIEWTKDNISFIESCIKKHDLMMTKT